MRTMLVLLAACLGTTRASSAPAPDRPATTRDELDRRVNAVIAEPRGKTVEAHAEWKSRAERVLAEIEAFAPHLSIVDGADRSLLRREGELRQRIWTDDGDRTRRLRTLHELLAPYQLLHDTVSIHAVCHTARPLAKTEVERFDLIFSCLLATEAAPADYDFSWAKPGDETWYRAQTRHP